jgi:putative phosphonate metabolism protein
MPERYGLYYAPPITGELWRHASIWLGRDAATNTSYEADVGGLDPERRHALTRSARRYGFHATLKAPMALANNLGSRDLDRALKAWTAAQAPVDIGPVVLRPIGGFLALVPERQSDVLTDFAAKVVEDFDAFRAPLETDERRRRTVGGRLTPRQIELLERFGYPYVLEEFRFHMTVSDQLEPADQVEVAAAATAWFEPFIGAALLLDRLVLFHEAEPGAPFRRLRDYPLTGGQ